MRNSAFLVSVLLLGACGGSGAQATTTTVVAAATPSDSASKDAGKAAVKALPHGHPFDTAAAGGVRPLVRETYRYEGSSLRDPFKPLVEVAQTGPELPDLRLVAILYDDRRPEGSIVTFHDIGNDKRYTLSPGQHLGRLSVVEVNATSAKLREDDFGTAREQTYSLRKPGDEKP